MPPKRSVNSESTEQPSRASKRVKIAPERFVPAPATEPAAKPKKSPGSKNSAHSSRAAKEATPRTSSAAKTKRTTAAAADDASPAAKRPRVSTAAKPVVRKSLPAINSVPNEILDVFVFGEGENGELGLGATKSGPGGKPKGVKRPRLNPFLSASTVGIVFVTVGAMHAAALTQDNKILTWGVNDQGACGRDTAWDGGLRDADGTDSDSEDDDDDTGLNPRESTPTAIPPESFPQGTIFTSLAAGDSCTFAVTDEGLVYGWGTFRDNQGVLGFTKDVNIAFRPMLIPELKKITSIACGSNHVLALDVNGSTFAWGAGQQNQLGRRIVERTRLAGLTPREFSLPKRQIKYISTGADHSFAITRNNKVYAWGLNNFGQCGVADNAGEGLAVVPNPTIVSQLEQYTPKMVVGGTHHSLALTEDGVCLSWGRADGGQTGLDLDNLPDKDVSKNERGGVGLVKRPTVLPGLWGKHVTTSTDHSILLNTQGRAYSWGFSGLYQTGLGTTDDIKTPTLIDNTATRDRNLNWAGTGSQFSAVASVAHPRTTTLPNSMGRVDQVNGTASQSTSIQPNGVSSISETAGESNLPNGTAH